MKRLSVCLLAAVFAAAALPAHAEQNEVQFGTDIHVPAGATVHDAVCFFCSVHVEGTVEGNLVVMFGNIHLAGHANHDVVNLFGKTTAEANATVGNNLVNVLGAIRLGENVAVGHDMVSVMGSYRAADSATVGNNRVIQPLWLGLVPLIVLAGLLFLVAMLFGNRRRHLPPGYQFPPR